MRCKPVNDGAGNYLGEMIECPGCAEAHFFPVPRWNFNGNRERPSFTPSMLIRSGHYAEGHKGPDCWCTYNAARPNEPAPFKCSVCHSVITDGRVAFCGDSTHALAGQTVELADLE